MHDRANHVLHALLLPEVRQDVNDAHEVDLGAIRADQTAILRLEESLLGSRPFVQQKLAFISLKRLRDTLHAHLIISTDFTVRIIVHALDF